MDNQIYGWFDDASPAPTYDPPHDAPCLLVGAVAGKRLTYKQLIH